MKHRFTAKLSAFLMAAALAAGMTAALPASATYNNSAMLQGDAFYAPAQTYWKYCEQYKFPAGKYWNGGNPDSYTSTACTNHNHDNYFMQNYVYTPGYTSCTRYVSGHQCYGFAAKLASDFYGGADVWIRFSNPSNPQFRVGDIVRIGNNMHSIFITEVNGSSIKFADCNWNNTCKIRWDVSATVTNNRIRFGGTSYSVYFIERPVMAGDVNGDSQITWADVDIISQIFRGIYDFSGKDRQVIMEAADLDNDGQISFNDVYIAYYQYDSSGYFRQQKFLTGVGWWGY